MNSEEGDFREWRGRRKSFIEYDGESLIISTGSERRVLPVGEGGISSAVHVVGGVGEVAGKAGHFSPPSGYLSTGCIHLCDEEGAGVCCLPVMSWDPAGRRKAKLEKGGIFILWTSVSDIEKLLEEASLVNFLRHAGIHVHSRNEEPPRSKKWIGVCRPRPSKAKRISALLFPILLIPFVTLVALVMKLFGLSSGEGGGVGVDSIIHWAIFLSFVLPFIFLALDWVANAERKGRGPSLVPSPGVPVSRAFKQRSFLCVDSTGNLVLRDAENRKRRMRPPSDSFTGVTEFWVLKYHGKPWHVLLVDRNGAIQAELPWGSWFSGDPALIGLRKFADELGATISTKECKPLPGQEKDEIAGKRSVSYWLSGSSHASPVNFMIPVIWFFLYVIFPPTGTHYQWLAFMGVAVALSIVLLRSVHQLLWLRGMVKVPPVSEVEYRWEREQKERESGVGNG
ncbi:hypothetical protein [Streptomyces sp. ST2-7A]|uniref:hypothetical protein n=1 Tax=Streptomyces sp. ST2-7A TaxID=2907214 RepID=UPI001F2DA9FC|nr:hypothetical protein [Streptomyces sp. ST2-7A]MCE7083165.1 hypothetical protein [Streptomyces sp. ST2-7A]